MGRCDIADLFLSRLPVIYAYFQVHEIASLLAACSVCCKLSSLFVSNQLLAFHVSNTILELSENECKQQQQQPGKRIHSKYEYVLYTHTV